MNDLIIKLAETANAHAREHIEECNYYGYYVEHNEYELRFNAKFAELIVKECCHQLILQGQAWELFSKNPLPGHENNSSAALFAAHRLQEDAVDVIKEHFGLNK